MLSVDVSCRPAAEEWPLFADIVEEVGESSCCWWEASRFGDEVGSVSCRPSGRPCRRYGAIAGESAFIGLSRASRLRFWAVAARRNSSLAPLGPLRRKRVKAQ